MRIKSLREHYVSKDGGLTWQPKRSFNSKSEVKKAGFSRFLWHSYTCRHCNKIHISSRND